MDLKEQIELIKGSGLFDEQWYLAQYPDVTRLKICPATHFARYGWRVGRNPSPLFQTRYYLSQYPDVARSGVNPLVHYLRFGDREGRRATSALTPARLPPRAKAKAPSGPAKEAALLPSAPSTLPTPKNEQERLAMQLEQTQQLLEHYYRRCQELELR